MKRFGRSMMALLLTFSLCAAEPARAADIADELADFWSRAGGIANYTHPDAFMGQQGGFITGGSLYMRTRPRSTNIARLDLPRVRAGCGGIDMYMGAFSFLSTDELVAMMEAIMAGAVGFAFELALESLSPAISETVGKLRDLAQRINSMNINSCEESQALVASLWPTLDNASQHICKTVGVEEGLFADAARSKHGCGREGSTNSTLDAASGELADQVPLDINYAWAAIAKHPYLKANPRVAELMMTLTGTMITRKGASDDVGPSHDTFPPRVFTPDMVRAFVEGGTLRVLRCPDDDLDKCLAPTWVDVTIEPDDAFFAQVRGLVDGLATAIQTNTAPPAGAANLIGMTSTPVYQALVQAASSRHAFITDEVTIIAELVAIELAMHFMSQGLEEMAEAGSKIDVFGNILGQYQATVRQSMDQFGVVRGEAREAYDQTMNSIFRIRMARDEAAARGSSRFAMALVR